MKRLNDSPSMMSILCASSAVPSVVATRAWVSPRWNKAEPCARGNKPTSQAMGRIWSKPDVRTAALVEDVFAKDPLLQGIEDVFNVRPQICRFLGIGAHQLFLQSIHKLVTLDLFVLLRVKGIAQVSRNLCGNLPSQLLIRGWSNKFPFLDFQLGSQLFLQTPPIS